MISEIEVTSARSLGDCYALLEKKPPGLRVLAGGTDMMVQVTAGIGTESLKHTLDIWRVPELRGIELRDGELVMGALTTYAELIESPLIAKHLPALAAVSREIGAWAIQNRGTLGGNICNASPAGDSLPLLLAGEAVFVLGSSRGERKVRADQFFVAYRKTALGADELLLRLEMPVDGEAGKLVYRKVGTRRAQSISKTLLSARAVVKGSELHRVRIAAGCLGPTPQRCLEAERAIEGHQASAAILDAVRAGLDRDTKPIDDVRSTAHYRRKVSGNVLARLLADLAGSRL